jgi:hypothetical protein
VVYLAVASPLPGRCGRKPRSSVRSVACVLLLVACACVRVAPGSKLMLKQCIELLELCLRKCWGPRIAVATAAVSSSERQDAHGVVSAALCCLTVCTVLAQCVWQQH